MRPNVYGLLFAIIAVGFALAGVWWDDLALTGTGIVFAIFAHAES